MIPTALNDWTLETIKLLLGSGVIESDRLDWKEMLPHKNDEKGKERLRKTCAAMANSSGGFLVFGVKDSTNLSMDERMVGINDPNETGQQFGEFPAKCIPPVAWECGNPPIKLPSGGYIFVVYIPPSLRAPHAVRNNEDLVFWKRSNKECERMAYDDIRASFEGRRHRERVLRALKFEMTLINDALMARLKNPHPVLALEIDLSTLNALTPDLLGIISDAGIKNLSTIRLKLSINALPGRANAGRFWRSRDELVKNSVSFERRLGEDLDDHLKEHKDVYENFVQKIQSIIVPLTEALCEEVDHLLSDR